MCNSSAEAIDAEIIDELRHGKKAEPNGKYDGIVQAIVEKPKEIRLGANHKETLIVKDMPIRLSINEWNALFSRYENDRTQKSSTTLMIPSTTETTPLSKQRCKP